MKNIRLLLILLSCSIGFSYGQNNNIVVGSKEYQEAKEQGALDQYNLIYTMDSFEPIDSDKAFKPKPNTGSPKSGNCDCYVEPDASYTLALLPNDDGSSGLINIPFNFNFYGTVYTSFYINNNGNITFVNPLATFSATAFPSLNNKIIAPFWGDVDTRAGNGEVVYKITPTAIYINWEDVGYYNQQGDKLNTFQLIISDGSDPAIPDGNNVAFCYQDMQWTTGSASQGVNGFGGVPATCGANKGDNVAYFLIARFDHPGTDFDGALGNPDGISWLDYKSFFFDVTNSNNIPPIPEGVSACDTFKVCAHGDTADISINFFAPEVGQTTSITWSDGGLTSLQEIANIPGNTAQLVLRVIGDPADDGTYTITVTATDDYAPTPGVTSMDFVIVIEDDPNFTLNPILEFTQACDSFEVNVLNGPYDTYLWDNLSNDPSTYITESGNFGVTVSLENCYKRVDSLIYVPKPANFNLIGNLYLCPGEDSTFIQIGDSASIDLIDWNLGDPDLDDNFSNWLTPGTYTLMNMDSTGLCANDTTFTIGQGVAATLNTDRVSCFGLNYQMTGASLGTDSEWSSPDPEISFSNTLIANPMITASTYGEYTLNLSTPCQNDLSIQIVFPFAPTVDIDTVICGNEFQFPANTITVFDAAQWSTLQPNTGTFTPSSWTIEPLFTATVNLPYQFQLFLTDSLCPNLKDTAKILMLPTPIVNIPDLACYYSALDITSTTPLGHTIQWSVSDNPSTPFLEDTAAVYVNGTNQNSNNPDIAVSMSGTYTVNYVISGGPCATSGSEQVYFPPYLYTEVNDTNLCIGVEFPLDALNAGPTATYLWNTGATGQTIIVTEPGVYSVTASNECHSSTDDAIIGYYLCDIEAPNVISLSSTNGNNVWFVDSDGIADFNCVIVNRWGNTIYEFNDVLGTWNGQDRSGRVVEEGTYFYTIKAKAYGGDEILKHGFIQVVH